jgi:D-alanyl-D-alanine endopeptidase (penicillin-binding protein 7)
MAMRIRLRAVLMLGAVMGTCTIPVEAISAVEKSKGRVESPKSRAPAPAAQKSKVEPVAQKGAVRPTTQKGKAATLARQGIHVPAAQKDKTGLRAAKVMSGQVAQSSRYAPVHVHASIGVTYNTQKRNLTKVFASNLDLWQDPGQLAVQSGSALVVGQDGGEPLYEKNANAIVPIASITKLMTAMVVLDSIPNLQSPITISDEDVDYLRGSRSRLGVGTVITRETALLLALMSSENRAANALGRHYPGGLHAFVAAMNRKAASLGMTSTRFEDPTGLNSNNVSTAYDLARMVAAAHRYPLIREFSTTPGVRAEVKGRDLDFHNTNQLVSSPTWEIGLSKTGYIQEAGKCLVMQARVADKPVVIVLLDSAGKQTRIGDANRIKRWMESASASGKLPTRV